MAALASIGAQAATQFNDYSLEVQDASPDNRISTGVTGAMGSNTHLSFRPRAADGAAAIIVDKDVAFTGYLQIGGGSTSPQDVNITFEDSATTPYTLSVKSIQTVGSRTKPSNIAVSGNGNVIVTGEANFAVESAGETTATWFFGQDGTFTTNTLSVGRLSTVTINNFASNSNITVSDDGDLTLMGSAVNAKALTVAATSKFASEAAINVTSYNFGGAMRGNGGNLSFTSWSYDGTAKTAVFNFKGFSGGHTFNLNDEYDVTINGGNNAQQFQGSFTLGAALKNFTVNAQLMIVDGGYLTVSAAKGTVKTSTLITVKSATVTLNTDALEGQSFNVARAGAKLIINADNKLGALALAKQDTNPNLQVTLNGHSLEFASIAFGDLDNNYVEFLDFAEGKVRVAADLVKNEDGTLKNIFAVTEEGRKALYQLENGFLSLSSVVPEPATCAAILGGLALAFAFMRRRK